MAGDSCVILATMSQRSGQDQRETSGSRTCELSGQGQPPTLVVGGGGGRKLYDVNGAAGGHIDLKKYPSTHIHLV